MFDGDAFSDGYCLDFERTAERDLCPSLSCDDIGTFGITGIESSCARTLDKRNNVVNGV